MTRRAQVGVGTVLGAILVVGVAALTWVVWPDDPPELAEGLPRGFEEGGAEFETRVVARFPPGSSAIVMMAELERQGFDITRLTAMDETGVKLQAIGASDGEDIWTDDQAWSAVFTTSNFVCVTHWSIRWRDDEQGRVANIAARRFANCL